MCCRERELCGFVHGDGFIITGDSLQMSWIESRLNEGLILKRRAILGPNDCDDKTVTILNRLVTWVCPSGSHNQIEIGADPRHRGILLAQMNLDGGNVKSVTIPAVKVPEWTPQMFTRKSTTCAHLFHGVNLINAGSWTQGTLSLSVAESEFYA